MKKGWTTSLIAAALFMASVEVSGAARADAITGTFTGVFASGSIDTYGYFGARGANLSGQTFSDTMTYISSGTNINDGEGSGIQIISTTSSGVGFNQSLTIGTVTVSFTSVIGGSLGFYQNLQYLRFLTGGTTSTTVDQIISFIGTSTPFANGLLDTQAGFNSLLVNLTAPLSNYSYGFQVFGTDGNAEFLSINAITSNSAVPEPSSVALLGGALMGLGYLRRRRAGAA